MPALARALSLAVAGTALLGAAAGPAVAADVPATVDVLGASTVRFPSDKSVAYVATTFTCTGGLSHLWVSLKQGPGDLSVEGSSRMAKAWYQKTLDNEVVCDGRPHTRIVTLTKTKGAPWYGPGYVQVCLLAGNTVEELQSGEILDSDMTYRKVRPL